MFQKALADSRESQASRRDQERARRLPPARTRSRALIVSIGEHSLVCLNSSQKISLKLERPTIKFISEYMVALARRVIQEVAEGGRLCPESVGSQAAFHFQASVTPNLRDKVTWDVTNSSWTVVWKSKGKKGKTRNTRSLPVDPSLSSEDFQAEKVRQYSAAVALWNAEDKSARSKVPTAESQPGAQSQAGH